MDKLREEILGLLPRATRHHLTAEMPLHDLRSIDIERLKPARQRKATPLRLSPTILPAESCRVLGATPRQPSTTSLRLQAPRGAGKTRYLAREEFQKSTTA
jgi:hypothetical protein